MELKGWYGDVIATHRVKDTTGNTVGFIVDNKKEV